MTAVQPIAAVTTAPASIRSDRWLVLLGLCGLASALALITATLVGGALREGYDPVRALAIAAWQAQIAAE